MCFNFKLLPEIEVAVTENIGRQFTGMRKPKLENTIVLGQSSTMMPKVVDFAKMPYENDHSSELLGNFTTHIIAITCPIDSRNESSFFCFLGRSKDSELAVFVIFDMKSYSNFVSIHLEGSMVSFKAKSAKSSFGDYQQFIVNQPSLIEKVAGNNSNLTAEESFLYARRLFGKTLASEIVFKETVSCVALAIERIAELPSDASNGVERFRFFEPYENKDFVVKIKTDSGVSITSGNSYILLGFKRQYPDDNFFLVS